jgi:hypothetical protein
MTTPRDEKRTRLTPRERNARRRAATRAARRLATHAIESTAAGVVCDAMRCLTLRTENT